MKKVIDIYGIDHTLIKLIDEDETLLSEYCKKLSEIFNATDHIILETTSGTAILKPSNIILINVSEPPEKLSLDLGVETPLPEISPTPPKEVKKPIRSRKKKKENIITDEEL